MRAEAERRNAQINWHVAEVGQILIPILVMLTIGLILSFNQSKNINLDRTFTVPIYNAIHRGSRLLQFIRS